jgi:hypothetical protein
MWSGDPGREDSPGPRLGPPLGPRFLVVGFVTLGECLGDVVGPDDLDALRLSGLNVVFGQHDGEVLEGPVLVFGGSWTRCGWAVAAEGNLAPVFTSGARWGDG